MSLSINASRGFPSGRIGNISRKSKSLNQFIRHVNTEASGISASGSQKAGVYNPWDPNNRIRVIGATIGVIGAGGMLFDTFYRRATKQELSLAMEKVDSKIDKLDAKIDGLTNAMLLNNQHVDVKIDNLTNALLHGTQRDKIAAEIENRELRREIERLSVKEPKS